jgi:cytochrome c-type biogenesis protein CcmE
MSSSFYSIAKAESLAVIGFDRFLQFLRTPENLIYNKSTAGFYYPETNSRSGGMVYV